MRSIVTRGQDQSLGWSRVGRRNRNEEEELLMPQSKKEFKSEVSAAVESIRAADRSILLSI